MIRYKKAIDSVSEEIETDNFADMARMLDLLEHLPAGVEITLDTTQLEQEIQNYAERNPNKNEA